MHIKFKAGIKKTGAGNVPYDITEGNKNRSMLGLVINTSSPNGDICPSPSVYRFHRDDVLALVGGISVLLAEESCSRYQSM